MQFKLNLLDENKESTFMNREWISLESEERTTYLQCYSLRDAQLDIVQMQQIGDSNTIPSTGDHLHPKANYYELQFELGTPCGYVVASLVFDHHDLNLSQKSLESFTRLFRALNELRLLSSERLYLIEQQVLHFIAPLNLVAQEESPFDLKPVWPENILLTLKNQKPSSLKTKKLYLVEVNINQYGPRFELIINQKYHCNYNLETQLAEFKTFIQQLYRCDLPSDLIQSMQGALDAFYEEVEV